VRHDAHRFVRPDAHRFLRPDAPGWTHPDHKLWNPHFRCRERQTEQARAAPVMARRQPDEERAAPAMPERVLGRSLQQRSGPSLSELLKLKSDGAALRVQLAVIRHETATRKARGLPPLTEADEGWQIILRGLARFQDACRKVGLQIGDGKAGFNPAQPRVPAGNPDGGQWTNGGGAGGGDSGAGGSVGSASVGGGPADSGSDPPKIPKERPDSTRLRNRVVKEVAKWLVKIGVRELTGPVGTALNIAEGVSWLYEAYPYVRAYTDAPKTLQELHELVRVPQAGYDVHHIVEQTAAEQDGYPRSQIDGPENLVRVPTLKHWEITGWYMTPNKDYNGASPRTYLRGKSWEERSRVGIEALIKHKVLVP
jgi:hypothetical protein